MYRNVAGMAVVVSGIRLLNAAFLLIGLVGLVVVAMQVDVDRLVAGLDQLGIGLLLAVLVHFAVIFCDSVVLALCTSRPASPGFLWFVYRAGLAGHAIGLVTPAAVGEVTKFTLLAERMPREQTAAAVLMANLLSFELTCAFIVVATLLSGLLLELPAPLPATLHLGAAVFFALGVAVPFLLRRGVPEWPYRLLGRFLAAERVERARGFVDRTAAEMGRQLTRPRRLAAACLIGAVSRIGSVTEIAVILAFLDAGAPFIVPFLVLVIAQVVRWLIFFVPFQAGTQETSAFFLFRALGLPPGLGVVLELSKKGIRLGFVGIGVAILGWQNFRRLRASSSR
jgi:hypothetical protein